MRQISQNIPDRRNMPDKVNYYVMLLADDTPSNPSGVARRRSLENGGVHDEAFKRDLSWGRTPLIAAAERGDMTFELVEVSKEEAERIIEGFRAKWGSDG
jgi:hypothetical protein